MSQRPLEGSGTDKQEKLPPVQEVAEQGAEPGTPPSATAGRKRLNSASKVIHKTLSVPQVKTLSGHIDIWFQWMNILILAVAVVALTVVVSLLYKPCCSDGWVGYQRKCYYFSEADGNWTYSQSHCSALGASLAGIDSLQELTFLMRRKGRDYHWIGLRREDEAQPWKWVNGAEFNNLFNVTGVADCAYLNDVNVSSSRCLTTKKWICNKPSWH